MEETIAAFTEEQKVAIRAAHQAAVTGALNQAKSEFRAGVAGSKKPDIFDPTQISIQAFIDRFEPFRRIMGLTGRPAINAFMTYLNTDAQTTLTDNKVLERETWEEFKENTIQALSPPQARVKARFEIKRAVQKIDETVEEFGKRLVKLGKTAYGLNENEAKDSALKDALAGGVRRDVVAVQLINEQDKDFNDLLAEAVNLDASYTARESMKSDDNYTVSVMQTGVPIYPHAVNNAPLYGGQDYQHMGVNASQIICYTCNQPGHYASQCTFSRGNAGGSSQNAAKQAKNKRGPINCWYCGRPNHVERNCFVKYRDMQMQASSTVPGQQGPRNYHQNVAPRRPQVMGNRSEQPNNTNVPRSFQPGLGFEHYNDQWSPDTQINSSREAGLNPTSNNSNIQQNTESKN